MSSKTRGLDVARVHALAEDISNRSRITSRSRKQYQNIDMAPRSSALVPSQDHVGHDPVELHVEHDAGTARGAALEVEQRLDRGGDTWALK
jgi:hypothetical protein